jgi:hypothetical protein
VLDNILVWISSLLHPNTKRQRGGVVATVDFDQREGRLLERTMEWFCGVSNEFR